MPQGSHLGPLLFIIYCHDVYSSIKFAKITQYADDTKIYMKITNDIDQTKLQLDIDSVAQWCTTNKLELNPIKTKHISFNRAINRSNHQYTILSSDIANESNIKDLGIHFDNKLTFKKHIATTITRVNQLIGFIHRRHRELKEKKILL